METPEKPSFPMTIAEARYKELEEFDFDEHAVEGMLKAYENMSQDDLVKFADTVAETALTRMREKTDLAPGDYRRLSGYTLLPYTLEAALYLSDLYAEQTAIQNDEPFIAASALALAMMHEAVTGRDKLSASTLRDFARDEVLKWSALDVDILIEPKSPPEPSIEAEPVENLPDTPEPEPAPPKKRLLSPPGKSVVDLDRPDFMIRPELARRIDQETLEPVARWTKYKEPNVTALMSRIGQDRRTCLKLAKMIDGCFNQLSRAEQNDIFKRPGVYREMVAYIEEGGSEEFIKSISGAGYALENREFNVMRIQDAWRELAVIANRLGLNV